MFDDPRWDDSRDRDDGRDRDLRVRAIEPRDVFMEGLDLPRGLERELVHERDREYTLRGSESVTRSLTLSAPVSAMRALAEIAEDLVRRVLSDHRDERTISLLAISVSNVEAHAIVQLELPLGLSDEGRRPGTKQGLARSRADRPVGAIRKRFGENAVDYGAASRVGRSVPEEFRRLVEKEL